MKSEGEAEDVLRSCGKNRFTLPLNTRLPFAIRNRITRAKGYSKTSEAYRMTRTIKYYH